MHTAKPRTAWREGGAGQKENEGGRGNEPRTFWMKFLEKAGPSPFPFDECSFRAATRTAMRVHFWHRHVGYTMVIL